MCPFHIAHEVAPAFLMYHWYCSVPVPVAFTVKVAVEPAYTAIFWGCRVMVGAILTVIVAGLETAVLPAASVTIQ